MPVMSSLLATSVQVVREKKECWKKVRRGEEVDVRCRWR